MLSPSESLEQPRSSTAAPATVVGHRSTPSGTPSPSPSLGQPRASTVAPAGVSGQRSRLSSTPSPSASWIRLLASIRLTPRLPPKLDRVFEANVGLGLLLFRLYRPSRRTITVGVIPMRKPTPPSRAPLLPQIGAPGLDTVGQALPYLDQPPPALR